MTSPIAPVILRRQSSHRESFNSDHPLPRFIVIPNFLRRSLLRDLVSGCQEGRYSTFCSYSRSEDMKGIRDEFCEPREDCVYLAVHQRPTRSVPAVVRLRKLFEKRETITGLSQLTGIALQKLLKPDALTCWGPGSFLERHTDHVPQSKARLVLSLSLTSRWDRSYGGATVFAWDGLERAVRLRPQCNVAVLFVPFSGSSHWVEQVSEHAPPRRRFTWTAFFS